MRNCKDCIFWPVCEDWSKDYYGMLGGKNPFPLEGDILDECQLYKSNKVYEIKKKVKMPKLAEYFGPVVAMVEYYEDDMLDQIYSYTGHKTQNGYFWDGEAKVVPDENHDITIYKANLNGEVTSYFPIERMPKL